ncbi:MAG: signal peptidase I [Polyangiaceae bacterium]
MNWNRLARYVYLAGFFVILPLAAAIAVVWGLSPDDASPSKPLGWLTTQIRDQRVPVAIVLFTLFELALWSQRHRLPWSDLLAPGGRSDVPPADRELFERAGMLLDESERILRTYREEIDKRKGAGKRADVEASLDKLRDALTAEKFDGDVLDAALVVAAREVDETLAPWRKSELREYTESITYAVAIALFLRVFVVEAFKIPSGSMIPTLQIGDHIFVNKMVYGPVIPWTRSRLFGRLPPKRGDVIVFEFPENRDQDFIKRVIATPGDKLEARDGHPSINGWRVPSCRAGTYTYQEGPTSSVHKAELDVEFLEDKAYLTLYERSFPSSFSEVQGPYNAKEGEVWVMGDNRHNSHDSRGWFEGRGGGVPFANIKGRAMFVWLSFDAAGKIASDRFGVSVMGTPTLRPADRVTLQSGVDACMASRPPLSATTPPAQTP